MHTQTKRFYWAVLVVVLTALIAAACIPAPKTQSAAPGGNAVPVTAPTNAAGSTATTAGNAASPTAGSSATASPSAAATATGNTANASKSSGGVTYVLVPDKSSASYAVTEQLARRSLPSDAVGKTSAISGQVVVKPDGSIDPANSKFTVDVSTLQTDSSMRDNFVARNILQSNQYKDVTFVPTQVSGLPSPLPSSGSVSFKVTGNLTIRDTTKPVTWDVTGAINNGEATGVATTSFTFEDFGLNQPQVPVVLSVVDKITLTANVDLKPQQ